MRTWFIWITGGKNLDCGSAESSVNLVLTRGHGSVLLDLQYFRAVGQPEVMARIRSAEITSGFPASARNGEEQDSLVGFAFYLAASVCFANSVRKSCSF